MKVRVLYNIRFLLKFNIGAITIYPFIFVAETKAIADKTPVLSHEMIHVQQVLKHGWLGFYLTYLWYYLKGLWAYKSHSKAYMNNPYEVEAYRGQNLV